MEPTARKPSFFDAFTSPRLALMVGLGFASGLPDPLTGSTLSAWLATLHVDVATIGLFSLVHLPYNLKFLWAPLLDRFALPLGRRRGWMLLTQVLILVGVGVMATLDPVHAPAMVAAMALAICVVSATQNIAVDAYRTEILPAEQRASGTAIFVASYRGAMIVAGAVALVLSEWISWGKVYLFLAALMSIGVITTLIAPTPETGIAPPRSLREAVVEPFREFLRRDHAILFLVVIMLYKVGDVVAGALRIPFLIDELDFSRAEVGVVLKGLGLGATIVGALTGGGLVARFGLKRCLIAFGLAQGSANVLYAWLAIAGKDHLLMTASICVDELMGGMGTAAFVALMMTLCNKRYTAMQYALFSSLMTVPGRLLGGASGFIANALGWPGFFLLTMVLAIPAIALIARVEIKEPADA